MVQGLGRDCAQTLTLQGFSLSAHTCVWLRSTSHVEPGLTLAWLLASSESCCPWPQCLVSDGLPRTAAALSLPGPLIKFLAGPLLSPN